MPRILVVDDSPTVRRLVELGALVGLVADHGMNDKPNVIFLGDELAAAAAEVVNERQLDARLAQSIRERAADEPPASGDAGLLHEVMFALG